jgi:hypothetical protein
VVRGKRHVNLAAESKSAHVTGPACDLRKSSPTIYPSHVHRLLVTGHHLPPPPLYLLVSLTHSFPLPSMFTCSDCGRRCKNPGGLTRHQNSVHNHDPRLAVPVAELQRVYHPDINGAFSKNYFIINVLTHPTKGVRCDQHGTRLPPNSPPEPPTPQANDEWSPFPSHAGFELADFLFSEAELSQKKIDKLLDIWAATLIPHDHVPPIANHQQLHRQIDAIQLGHVKWESITLKHNNPLPTTTRPPEWKTTEYDVWYRNPREVIKTILMNTDFDGHIDYAPYQEFNEGKRQYGDMMSGDWVWRQCVRPAPHYFSLSY